MPSGHWHPDLQGGVVMLQFMVKPGSGMWQVFMHLSMQSVHTSPFGHCGGEGAFGGEGGGGEASHLEPQSVQSVPLKHNEREDPRSPSSQTPFEAEEHVLSQHVVARTAGRTASRNIVSLSFVCICG